MALEKAPPEVGSVLRARILAEATRLFASKGYAATSVREVVEACGCTKPALYYYFRSKEALFLEAIRAETELITAILEAHLSREGSARWHMTDGLRMYLDHVRDNPMGMRLLFRADLQPDEGQPVFDFVTLRATHMSIARSMIEVGVANGEIRPDVDLEDATMAIIGIADRWFQDWLRGGSLPHDLPERVMSIFFDGVGAKREAR
jgi:TetR/AcrR family transcriptional regulator